MKSIIMTAMLLAGLISTLAFAENTFQLTSPDISEGEKVDLKHQLNAYGCTGENISPALMWSGAPEGTKSFVVTFYDPDTASGSGWWHWVVFDIPADVTSLPQGAGSGKGLPEGAIQTRTDFGTPGYAGSCPPPGEVHRYQFQVRALGVEGLDLDENATPAMVGFLANANALASARITSVLTR
ncbi:MAG: YbhB/YbcL family Raf kinase inhibitor-like protein [bacterium]|nr:YbhB/YbcL family Raf kinase inhibitor-like protein [bacterium]